MKVAPVQDTLFEIPDAIEDRAVAHGIPPVSALEADFPAGFISRIAEHESWRKEVHRPATHTHKWWAQRLGTVFRGILCSAVTTNSAAAMDAYTRGLNMEGMTVFDPFSGSGTTLVEGAKLGASVIGRDINPVAVLVQRQALQGWDVAELEQGYQTLEALCRPEIDRLHSTDSGEPVLYYFWVAIASCPDCGRDVRLFSTPVFAQHAYPRRRPTARAVCPVCLDIQTTTYDFEELTCANGHVVGRSGSVSGAHMSCPVGHRSRVIEALAGHAPKHELYAKLVLGGDGGKRYEPATTFDRALFIEAAQLLALRGDQLVLPRGTLEEGYNTRQAMRWGYAAWSQFFNSRQLYSLGLLATAIRDLDVAPPEREALAALFSGTLEFNNLFCSFKGEGTGAVRHMFSHHVLKPERTPLEAHPWGTPSSSGAFSTLYKSRLLRAHEYKARPTDHVVAASGEIIRVGGVSQPLELTLSPDSSNGNGPRRASTLTGDSSLTNLADGSVDLIITDPPYMDNVHYSELADFFHAWLRSIRPFAGYPESALTTRADGEVQSTSADDFEQAIGAVWRECFRVLKVDGVLAFTFHQARITGWVALCASLRDASLRITALQPIKGDMTTSVAKAGAAEPSTLDSVVVCRKGSDGPTFANSPDDAGAKVTESLSRLREAGVSFGLGDVRSVSRGGVLSLLTNAHATYSREELLGEAERVADIVIDRLGWKRTG